MNFEKNDLGLKLILFAAFLAYLPFTFLGYGSDNDSYGVIFVTAKAFYTRGVYVPSRYPGYPVHETATAALNYCGGSFLSNFGTLLISLFGLFCFYRICEFYQIRNRLLILAAVAVHPLYLVNSTSTIDYVWAVGLFLSGFYLYRVKDRYFAAAVLFGLSFGCRLSSFLLVFTFFLTEVIFHFKAFVTDWRRVGAAVLTNIVAVACYFGCFVFAGYNLSFLTYYIGDWTYFQYLVRFIYKNVYFWGLPAFLLLAALVLLTLIRARKRGEFGQNWWANREIYFFSTVTVILVELLFLKVPLEEGYLLPALPFGLLLINLLFGQNVKTWTAFLILLATFNLVNFNLLKADEENNAKSARIGFFIEKGYSWADIKKRDDAAETYPAQFK